MSEVGRRLGDADTLPAAPGSSLHKHGVPDAFRRCSEIIWLLRVREARDDRHPGFGSKAARFDLGPHGGDALGLGPIQTRPASRTAWAKSAFSERKP